MKRILFTALLGMSLAAFGQTEPTPSRSKRAWEIGVGGTLTNWNRVVMSGFQSTPEGYVYDTDVRHIIGGPHIYIGRELASWLYLDAQGSLGISHNSNSRALKLNKHDLLWQGGVGLQFRATPLFKAKYVEPFARIGVNYLHKNFDARYAGGFEGDVTGKAHWKAEDTWNKLGRAKDRRSFVPLSLGTGFHAWFSDSWGVGVLGEYLLPLEKDLPRVAQGSLRLLYRIGGASKQRPAVVERIEVPVDRIVEKRVVERVEVPVEKLVTVYELIDNIEFDFDKDLLTARSVELIEEAASFLKRYPNERFLLTGQTDARGSVAYNLDLSRRRAKAVYDALIARGVPAEMLKWRGIQKAAHAVPASADHKTRRGDRKVQIERITNMDYWAVLK